MVVRSQAGAEDPAARGKLGLARHALGAAPSRAGASGPGWGLEFVGASPPSLSPGVAWDDDGAFGALDRRGQ